MSPLPWHFPWRVLSVCIVVGGFAGGALEAADPRAERALAAPDAKHIPPAQLERAARQAVANGAATILARIMAAGNDTGLAYPPQTSRKLLGLEDVPARKVSVEEAVYEDEWKDVEQMVPEMSAGMPTGRFIPGKVRKLVRRTKVGTRSVDKFIPDPDGTHTMKVPTYERSGPDLYEPNMLGLNGMALHVLVRAGLEGHSATKQLAQTLDDRMREFGISDHTFDVAWLAAGFAALGKESSYRERAEQLIGKLIDGQIREKGDSQGLWGPVCIHYSYLAKLLEIQEQLRTELEVNLPKKLDAANPQQQAALAKQSKELRKVYGEFNRSLRDVSSYGLRMQKITEPYSVSETARLPALPLYVYNRVVADVESTAIAAFALAEAKRAGLLPKETERLAIRGKKVAVPEKTANALKAAAAQVAKAIGGDGGCSMLTVQAVNHGFDTCRIPIPDVPAKGELPPLFNAETASSCAHGFAALESLASADTDVVKGLDAERDRARKRVTAIAERWYRESAPDPKNPKKPWASIYEDFSVSQSALKESAALPLPGPTSPPVNELPWGGVATKYAILPVLAMVYAGKDAKSVLETASYRQIAYRLVDLQNANGQWWQPGYDSLSSGKDALAINHMAQQAHRQLNHIEGLCFVKADPITFQMMLNHHGANELKNGGGWAGASSIDPGVIATLTSMLFLLQGLDGPVDVQGITLRPEAGTASELAAADEKQAAPRRTSSLLAVTGAERPNAERAALLDGVLVAQQIKPTAPPAVTAEAAPTPAAEPAAETEKENEDLGSVDDLLKAE